MDEHEYKRVWCGVNDVETVDCDMNVGHGPRRRAYVDVAVPDGDGRYRMITATLEWYVKADEEDF